MLPEEQSVSGVIEALRAANEDLVYVHDGTPANTINEITYADEDGVMQFLRRCLLSGAYKFHPHRDQVLPKKMLEHFRSNLNYVTELLCIGYGFGDAHINAILRGWLETSSERRLEIVGPGVKDVPAALLHVSPQVTLVNSTGTEYLDKRTGIERTPLERTAKRFANWARSRPKQEVQQEFAMFVAANQERLARQSRTSSRQCRSRRMATSILRRSE